VEFISKKISIFLACNLFVVTLFAVPKFELGKKSGTTKIEISTDDSVKIQGYTKNEISTSQHNVDQSLKESKAFKYFDSFIFDEILQNIGVTLTDLNLLLFTGAIQLALKALIFPFHSFW